VPTGPGGSAAGDPAAGRVGRGQPDGRRQGFKKDYRPGELAPTAVITDMPRVLRRVEAYYPERMKQLGVEGSVVLELTIDAQGKVIQVRLVRGLRSELDREATIAAKKMHFSPARVNKTAVAIKIKYTFSFVLD
jgi:protein TonB